MSIACALTVDMSFHINMLNPNMMDQIINEKISYAHRMPGHSVIYYSFTFGQKSPTYMPIWFVGESISIANVRKFVQNAMMCGNLGKSKKLWFEKHSKFVLITTVTFEYIFFCLFV